ANDPNIVGKLLALIEERLPTTGTIDIHFIGHSRGVIVNLRVIQSLTEEDNSHIGRLQMTTLDPQPFSNPIPIIGNRETVRLVVPPNVDYADNYYQTIDPLPIPGTDGILGGGTVQGAVNIDLTPVLRNWNARVGGFGPHHSEVHGWYHWTIDTND